MRERICPDFFFAPNVRSFSRVGATTCLSAALRARKQLGAPSLLRVESTVCFQRKRGLPSSIKTKAGQSRVVVHWEFGCDWCALTICFRAAVWRHWCSWHTALWSEDWQNATFAQIAYCTRVSGWRLWDIRAVGVLRYGLKIGRMRPSRRWCSALEPLVCNLRTLVQLVYCARVYGRLFA